MPAIAGALCDGFPFAAHRLRNALCARFCHRRRPRHKRDWSASGAPWHTWGASNAWYRHSSAPGVGDRVPKTTLRFAARSPTLQTWQIPITPLPESGDLDLFLAGPLLSRILPVPGQSTRLAVLFRAAPRATADATDPVRTRLGFPSVPIRADHYSAGGHIRSLDRLTTYRQRDILQPVVAILDYYERIGILLALPLRRLVPCILARPCVQIR